MTNTFFETKEQYLNFRAAWSAAVNSNKAKTTTGSSGERFVGWVQAEHFILYNLLRGRPAYRGFSLKTKYNCLVNGATINHGYARAGKQLGHMIRCAKKIVDPENQLPDYAVRSVQRFLEPFNKTITIEMLAALKFIAPTYWCADYTIGKEIATRIRSGEKIKTFEDVAEFM